MKFQTATDEFFFASGISPEESYMFDEDLRTGLTIAWNTGHEAMFMIDKQTLSLPRHCLMFLTEHHRVDRFTFTEMNVIQFNRPFYCVEEDDSEVGCKGVLFFGASSIPQVHLPSDQEGYFQLIWDSMQMEIEEMESLKLEMLRLLLKRFLILCLRLHRKQNLHVIPDDKGAGLIREFNFLVEKHFRTRTKVSEYADLLHKSPKTVANIFHQYSPKTPLQIINDRRYLEARRQLLYTDHTVQQIAYDINFKDVTSFSYFFRSMAGQSPSQFRMEFADLAG
ncbi:MAG TPA: AraC family transcriptional regulator [Cytophagales bacterium]|nr:AraC family transcriptional regulator [Cytophagales bacterium]HAA20706.1 AraC family transcriptional regulator [Cytophagales bacterium]HAP63751.1 AraC family transcriptional regulator [Cytophagales bacterium]